MDTRIVSGSSTIFARAYSDSSSLRKETPPSPYYASVSFLLVVDTMGQSPAYRYKTLVVETEKYSADATARGMMYLSP